MKMRSLIIKLLLVCCVGILSFTTQAHALDIPEDCRDLQMLRERWSEKYHAELGFASYETLNDSLPYFTCNSDYHLFARAIWVIENLKNSPEFTAGYGSMYERIRQQVRTFEVLGVENNKNQYACTTSGKISPDIYIYKCFNFLNPIIAASGIVHELRHIELGKPGEHILCEDGRIACDRGFDHNVETASTYSFEILYLRDILKNNSLNRSIKAQIERAANNLQRNSF